MGEGKDEEERLRVAEETAGYRPGIERKARGTSSATLRGALSGKPGVVSPEARRTIQKARKKAGVAKRKGTI
jgi:hypothetical protein